MTRDLELLAEFVAIPTHVSQPEGVERLGSLVGRELLRLGFVEGEPLPSTHRLPPWAEKLLSPEVSWEALLDPLVFHRPGKSSGMLLLLGDLDSALVVDAPALRVVGNRVIGPAVADMKGGLVAMLAALSQIADRATPDITVVLSRDEQAGSLRSAATIEHMGRKATWALCLECARDGGRLMHSRAQVGVGRAVAIGREHYAGMPTKTADNPAFLLARLLSAVGEVDVEGATITPTILRAGLRRSLVPNEAMAVLDARATDARVWEQLEERLATIPRQLEQGSGSRRAAIDVVAHRPALVATSVTKRMLEFVQGVASRNGLEVAGTPSMAAGSSAFVDPNHTAVLDGIGPAGGDLMTPGEFIEIESLSERAHLLAEVIAGMGAGEAPSV
jgi:glutamate carboxypeptidase